MASRLHAEYIPQDGTWFLFGNYALRLSCEKLKQRFSFNSKHSFSSSCGIFLRARQRLADPLLRTSFVLRKIKKESF